ncbi:ABC transporter ATP-binding protein [Azotobacter chroococcum]|uniref:ATP binding component of ABC transporter n=1 Tax=Azotobacter chroococcum NCIMB 8003 TaxID=1328314 RepID=A0A0C4WWV5_9GAMM|nr:ATP-binding cassette domain-containing protein [Azotobacter chroococcum]AJE23442.1 ATP binding component of ABC transporter [Azotobacter chroococcum NCIMB 8003]
MLHIENLAIHRGTYRILLPRLSLARGEVAAITGASGCGKSTLLEMIGLILRPERLDRYELTSDEDDGAAPLDIAALLREDRQARLADLRAQRLGFVPQSGGLLPFLDVRRNIELPRRMLGLPATGERVEEAIEQLGLQPLLHKKPAQLSIGERQRASFVRAIAHEPDLLLADEPTAALDPLQARRLFELIVETTQRLRIATLLVSHDWGLLRACAIRRLVGVPDADNNGGTVFRDAS